MMDLMTVSDSRVPNHVFMDQAMEMHGATPTLFCNSDFAMSRRSYGRANPMKKVLSLHIKEKHFDDEVMMDLMRGSVGQPCAGTMQNRRCFCNTEFATVKSSAWTYHSNEHILSLDIEKERFDD